MAHQNEIKLNKSRIPVYTHFTTLQKEGHAALADITKHRKWRNSDNGMLRSYHIEPAQPTSAGVRTAIHAAAIFAKELCLSGNPVCYVGVAEFLRELHRSTLPRETLSLNPVMEHLGRGYIVIPEFHSFDAMAHDYEIAPLLELESIMVSHMDAGGAFIFSGINALPKIKTQFGQSFLAAYDRNFISLKVA